MRTQIFYSNIKDVREGGELACQSDFRGSFQSRGAFFVFSRSYFRFSKDGVDACDGVEQVWSGVAVEGKQFAPGKHVIVNPVL